MDLYRDPQPSTSKSNCQDQAEDSDLREYCCIVCYLIKQGFSKFNFQRKCSVISAGRPEPILEIQSKSTKCMRYFNKSIYDNCKWLTGCKTVGKLFCWPCLLFHINVKEKTVWTSSGYSDLNNLHKSIKRHALTKAHLEAVLNEKTFEKTRIKQALDNQLKASHRQHNNLVRKNRDILKRLIDITCFLCEHELSFQGNSESVTSVKRENFMDLADLLSKYDELLKNHLDQLTVFRGMSNRIQNDLMNAMAHVVLQKIKDETKEAHFVSIVLDATTDVTNLSQLSVVLRYVKENGAVQERFWGFLNITEDRTADRMYRHICEIVNELDCGSKLVAQSYDGAALMAGHLGSLQAKVEETFHNATFVHCFAHRLNLVLAQSLARNKECKVFFQTLSGMASFFSKSSKRTQALDAIVKKRFPRVSPTRWNYNGRLVKTVSQYRQPLIELFKTILEHDDQWDPETVNSSRGYLMLLKNNSDFNFLCKIFSEIFPYTDILFDVLQTKFNDIELCVQKIGKFEVQINNLRNEFESIWQKTSQLEDNMEPRQKRIRIDDVEDTQISYRQLFFEILDNISQQLHERFKNLFDLKFVELCNFDKYGNSRFPEEAFNSLKKRYANYYDILALHSQLSVLYSSKDAAKANDCSKMLKFLKETGLDEAYNEVSKLCELVLTIPATSSSVERSFSVLKRVENFIRNSTSEERLANLAVLSIEKELIKDLSQKSNFYDSVIDEFAKKERRIELHYK